MSDTALGKSASELAGLAAAAAAVDLALAKSKLDPLTSIPAPGPIINFVGHGVTAIWDNVWDHIKGESANVADQVVAIPTYIGDQVKKLVEAYTGNALAAISGFINDLSDYTHSMLNLVNNFAIDGLVGLSDDIVGIDGHLSDIFDLLGHVVGIDIPNIETLLGDLAGAIDSTAIGTIDLLQTWAIDNIEAPLLQGIAGIEANIYSNVGALITQALADAKAYADARTAAIAATIAGTAAAAAVATTWIEDCGAPMCEEFGPASTLGPLLNNAALIEILQLLLGLAVLADPNLDEKAALLFAKTFGPGIQSTMTNWLVPLQADLSDATR